MNCLARRNALRKQIEGLKIEKLTSFHQLGYKNDLHKESSKLEIFSSIAYTSVEQ